MRWGCRSSPHMRCSAARLPFHRRLSLFIRYDGVLSSSRCRWRRARGCFDFKVRRWLPFQRSTDLLVPRAAFTRIAGTTGDGSRSRRHCHGRLFITIFQRVCVGTHVRPRRRRLAFAADGWRLLYLPRAARARKNSSARERCFVASSMIAHEAARSDSSALSLTIHFARHVASRRTFPARCGAASRYHWPLARKKDIDDADIDAFRDTFTSKMPVRYLMLRFFLLSGRRTKCGRSRVCHAGAGYGPRAEPFARQFLLQSLMLIRAKFSLGQVDDFSLC